jgi:hypothetical protein
MNVSASSVIQRMGAPSHVGSRVDVRHFGPGGRRGQRAAAGITEEIQKSRRASGGAQPRGDPVPIGHLLGKQAHLAEVRKLQSQRHRAKGDGRPGGGDLPGERPATATAGLTVEARVGRRPLVGGARPGLRGRRGRPIDQVSAESLQPAARSEIEQLIRVAGEHRRQASWRFLARLRAVLRPGRYPREGPERM